MQPEKYSLAYDSMSLRQHARHTGVGRAVTDNAGLRLTCLTEIPSAPTPLIMSALREE